MLSSLKWSNFPTTRRTGLALAILAIAGLAPPLLLKHGAENGFAGQKDDSDAGVSVQRDGTSSNKPPVAGGARKATTTGEIDEYFPRPAAAEREILEALEKPVDVEFPEMALERCLEKLGSRAKIDIWFDKAKLNEEGVSLEQPVTLILKGRKLESVLNLLLRPVELTFLYEDEVLRITTSQAAGDTLITRTYPVGDLCPELKDENDRADKKTANLEANPDIRVVLVQGFGGGRGGGPKDEAPAKGDAGTNNNAGQGQPRRVRNRFAALMNAIETTVQPDSWECLSGPGSMVPVSETNSLVIRQTWSVHRQVLQLLRDLRAAKRLPDAAPVRANP